METRANYAAVGFFVLVVVAALVGTLIWLSRTEINQTYANYDVYFSTSVVGLNRGAPVRFNGLLSGRVMNVAIDPQNLRQVIATIEVRTDVPIRQDTSAGLQSQGLTGVPYIELTGGSPDSPALTAVSGEPNPIIVASGQGGLNQALNSAPQLISRLTVTLDRVNDILGDSNRAAIGQTLDNLRRASGAIADRSGDIKSLMSDAAGTAHDLRGLIATLDRTSGQIGALLGQAGTSLQRLNQLADGANGLLTDLRPGLRGFAQNGAPELTQLLIEARQLVANWSRVADQFERDPGKLLFGDRREGYSPR